MFRQQDWSWVGELAGGASWSATPRVQRSSNLSLTGDQAVPSARQSSTVTTPGRDLGPAVGAAAAEPFLRLKASGVSVVPWLGLGLVIQFTSCHRTWALDLAIGAHPRNSHVCCSRFRARAARLKHGIQNSKGLKQGFGASHLSVIFCYFDLC